MAKFSVNISQLKNKFNDNNKTLRSANDYDNNQNQFQGLDKLATEIAEGVIQTFTFKDTNGSTYQFNVHSTAATSYISYAKDGALQQYLSYIGQHAVEDNKAKIKNILASRIFDLQANNELDSFYNGQIARLTANLNHESLLKSDQTYKAIYPTNDALSFEYDADQQLVLHHSFQLALTDHQGRKTIIPGTIDEKAIFDRDGATLEQISCSNEVLQALYQDHEVQVSAQTPTLAQHAEGKTLNKAVSGGAGGRELDHLDDDIVNEVLRQCDIDPHWLMLELKTAVQQATDACFEQIQQQTPVSEPFDEVFQQYLGNSQFLADYRYRIFHTLSQHIHDKQDRLINICRQMGINFGSQKPAEYLRSALLERLTDTELMTELTNKGEMNKAVLVGKLNGYNANEQDDQKLFEKAYNDVTEDKQSPTYLTVICDAIDKELTKQNHIDHNEQILLGAKIKQLYQGTNDQIAKDKLAARALEFKKLLQSNPAAVNPNDNINSSFSSKDFELANCYPNLQKESESLYLNLVTDAIDKTLTQKGYYQKANAKTLRQQFTHLDGLIKDEQDKQSLRECAYKTHRWLMDANSLHNDHQLNEALAALQNLKPSYKTMLTNSLNKIREWATATGKLMQSMAAVALTLNQGYASKISSGQCYMALTSLFEKFNRDVTELKQQLHQSHQASCLTSQLQKFGQWQPQKDQSEALTQNFSPEAKNHNR